MIWIVKIVIIEGKVYLNNMMKLTLDNMDKLKIWWNIAFEEGNTAVYDKCADILYECIGEYIEVNKCKKMYGKWDDCKMQELIYIPMCYLDENGIIDKYYSKDDIVKVCGDNKVVGKFIYRKLKGEFVEDAFKYYKSQYLEWLCMKDNKHILISEVGRNMFRVMTDEEKAKVRSVRGENFWSGK